MGLGEVYSTQHYVIKFSVTWGRLVVYLFSSDSVEVDIDGMQGFQ
jgi:hypothetical protein